MGVSLQKPIHMPVGDRYNGHVYLVPTDNWQLAIWAAAQSTRLVESVATASQDESNAFKRLYLARNYAPVIWYTPGGALNGEVYDFLHRLPGIGRIIVLCEKKSSSLPKLDLQNLKAMLDNIKQWGQVQPFFNGSISLHEVSFIDSKAKARHKENTPLAQANLAGNPFEKILLWLNLKDRIADIAVEESPLPIPRVIIVVPSSPYFACAVGPLAAYVQATVVYTNLLYTSQEDLTNLANAIVPGPAGAKSQSLQADEIWLVGPAQSLKKRLRDAINLRRREEQRFDRPTTIRMIPGEDHFTVSEQSAVMLLAYRYFDWMLMQSATHPDGREFFFNFLAASSMQTLHHYCNRLLDVADQVKRNNLQALADLHDVIWIMSDGERRNFIQQFQQAFKTNRVVVNNLAVVADYGPDEAIPHHLIDAAAFAVRRASPLLLLQPLPAETSYYIGSLMDKIDDRLNALTLRQIEKVKLDASRYAPSQSTDSTWSQNQSDEILRSLTAESPEANEEWEALKERIKELNETIYQLKMGLHQSVYKTGEVLYESLVPLAVRKTLSQLQPRFLAAFIQDPSLPIELICESQRDQSPISGSRGSLGEHALFAPQRTDPIDDLDRFWSLRYAIGHISSLNFYETNLTSNISFFTPRMRDEDNVRVLLCSNPTRDLFFSGQEAKKIAKLFLGEKLKIGGELVSLTFRPQVHRLDNEEPGALPPTRENLISEFRQGYDIVHYSGHAFFDNVLPGRSGLLLRDGVLTASDVRFMLNLNRNPIIYANACSAGRIKSVSSRFTGLAAAFIRAGAVGYISPLWSIDDQDASALAAEYYRALLHKNKSIGECLQQAKREQARTGSITWASLVLYGDPTLSMFISEDE